MLLFSMLVYEGFIPQIYLVETRNYHCGVYEEVHKDFEKNVFRLQKT